jgi:hypothetical protein
LDEENEKILKDEHFYKTVPLIEPYTDKVLTFVRIKFWLNKETILSRTKESSLMNELSSDSPKKCTLSFDLSLIEKSNSEISIPVHSAIHFSVTNDHQDLIRVFDQHFA